MFFVLDLDDTLFFERDYVRSGFEEIDRWLKDNRSVTGFFERAWDLFSSGVRGNIFDLVLQDLNLFDKELVDHFVHLYRIHAPKISLLPQALDFLQRHNREDLAVITDGYPSSQWAKIRALDIERFVSKIIVTDDWGKEFRKPHPRAFFSVQGNRPPGECVYLGDNPQKDFKAPTQLGWASSIRVRYRESLHYRIDTPDSCIEVASLAEVPAM